MRDQDADRKLDMALDDLVMKDGGRRREREREALRSRSPYRERRETRGRDFGKGKGKRRIAPEDKALMNTRCFFNPQGDLVVRLYDTEVFVLKQQSSDVASVAPEERTKNNHVASEQTIVADGKPAAAEEGTHSTEAKADRPEESEAAGDGKTSDVAITSEKSEDPCKPAASETTAEESAPAVDGKAAAPEEIAPTAESPSVVSKEPVAAAEVEAKTVVEKESADIEKAKPAGDEKMETTETKPAAQQENVPPDAQPVTVQENAAVAETKPVTPQDKGGLVVVLNSGRFRTIETKFIINQAASPLSIRILHTEAHQWTVCGDGLDGDRPFEDKMELRLKSEPSRVPIVKEHMEGLIQESKDRERHGRRRGDYDAPRDHLPPSHGYRSGMPPPMHWPPGPPGWLGAPPAGWPPLPHHGVPPHHGAPPCEAGGPPHHRPPAYGAPLTAASPPARHRGPLPDSMFQ